MPPVTPGDASREPRDETGPGEPFWELSPQQQRRAQEEHRAVSAGPDDSVEYTGTDLVGRRSSVPGPHEPVPGEPRGSEHLDQAGEGGTLLPYHRWTRKALYDRARTLGVKGRSRMTKDELIEAIKNGDGPAS